LLCREEAAELSKALLPHLTDKGVKLYGVVHEERGVDGFRPYLQDAPIYLDSSRELYQAIGDRWLGLTGFLKPSVWKNVNRAKQKGFEGNMEGEGRLLGGVLVVGPNDMGILFEHREEVWGDHADVSEVVAAVKRIEDELQQYDITNA